MDRYEVQAIARDEARALVDGLRRDLEFGALTQLSRELEALCSELRQINEALVDAMRTDAS